MEKLAREVIKQMEAKLMEEQGMQSFIERSQQIQSIEKLPGDASTRRYYRVNAQDSQGQARSLIVMVMEPFTEKGKNIPFLSIHSHLAKAGVDVPKVIDFDPAQGFILLEDLGDVTLLRSLQDVASVQEERTYFEKAIDALCDMHVGSGPNRATSDEKQVIDGFKLFFDREKLMWEVNFCIEHFYQKHLQRKFTDRDLKTITDGFTQICTELEREPTVFTHRDYHSRNLMVAPNADGGAGVDRNRYVMIDFQDARMGPCTYDVASLLRDSYYQLSEPQIEHLTN
jgi:aminoglycoside/choline kinase family phosphotransferase